ncbi:LPXTG cell wall anchor domain-containing protein [Mycetocola zhadangensis]|uniref:LPXTG cell wall anchor domain-containing protein n=2 Tax=Mycetocola zhadangensis TaxID=1164595 RepID=A0A3L7J5D7_9MICO|nr:LPXTG cell wall anchor domain-containing protein [Mycetocola zhadangensis]
MAEVTTTTTTVSTGWNLDTATSTWVAAEPVTTVADAKRAATPVECPVAAAQPAQADDIEASPVAETLPETGSDAGWVVLIAGGLVLVGVQLMLMQRTRRVARENQS